jgi:hypothetical protein
MPSDYTIGFDDKSDQVTIWIRNGAERLRRMIQEGHDRGILTPDETFDIAATH